MADFNVAGLTGGGVGYNGDYSANGTEDGYTAYTDGTYWLYHRSSKWALANVKGSAAPVSTGGSDTSPLTSAGAWTAWAIFGTPVVTAISSAVTHHGDMACDTVAAFEGQGDVVSGGTTHHGDLAADTVAAFTGQGYGIFVGDFAADTIAGFDSSGTDFNANDRGSNLTDDTWDDTGDTTAHMGTAVDNLGYFIRFPVTAGAGATILTAILTLEAALSQSGVVLLRATLLDYDNCGQFTDANFAAPSNASLSATYIEWEPPAWVEDTRYELDVKTLIQAFVDRAGYASGQYVGLLIATGGE